jgi:hypothetical protein
MGVGRMGVLAMAAGSMKAGATASMAKWKIINGAEGKYIVSQLLVVPFYYARSFLLV